MLCHHQMRLLGRSLFLPVDVLTHLFLHQRPPLSKIQELARKSGLHTTDHGPVSLYPTSLSSLSRTSQARDLPFFKDDSVHIYV